MGADAALACGLAWTAEGIALARGVRFTSLTLGTTVLLAGVMVTPAVAAFIVRRFITREGFATAGLRFGPRRPDPLVVWLGMPLLVAGIYALTVLIGLGRFDPTLAQGRPRENGGGGTRAAHSSASFTARARDGDVCSIAHLRLTSSPASSRSVRNSAGRSIPGGGSPRWAAGACSLDLRRHQGTLARAHYCGRLQLPGVPCSRPRDDVPADNRLRAHPRQRFVYATTVFTSRASSMRASTPTVWAILPMFVAGVSPILGGVTGIVGIVTFMALGVWLLARTPEPQAGRVASIYASARV